VSTDRSGVDFAASDPRVPRASARIREKLSLPAIPPAMTAALSGHAVLMKRPFTG
jgi:hypothetical protein